MPKQNATDWRLDRIEIEGLYHKYDYPEIKFTRGRKPPAQLNFLYGDNGAGKTTILKLIYALMSSEIGAGYKTFLSRTEFRRVAVHFGKNRSVVAERESARAGDYKITASIEAESRNFAFVADENLSILSTKHPGMGDFFSFVSDNFPNFIFVTDHRNLRASFPINKRNLHQDFSSVQFDISLENRPMIERERENDLEELSRLGLLRILALARSYISNRVLRSNARANQSSSNIYLRVARAITRKDKEGTDLPPTQLDLISRMENLLPDLSRLNKFGLQEADAIPELLNILRSDEGKKSKPLISVLSPYVTSIEDRVLKTRDIANLVETFQGCLNDFFKDKNVIIEVGEPIRIVDRLGDNIDPSTLSSGERHILNLCTVALLSTQVRSVILIDEPELSLNFKWQSILSDSLAAISGETSQYIMATHSFEIISQYKENIREVLPLVRER